VVFAAKTEVLVITRDADGVDLLHRWFECYQALAVSVGRVQAIERPDSHLVILAPFFKRSTNSKGIILISRARHCEELVNVVCMSFIKQSLFLQWRVVAKQQVGLGEEDLLRQLGVTIEENGARSVVRVPPNDSIQPHDRVGLQDELL